VPTSTLVAIQPNKKPHHKLRSWFPERAFSWLMTSAHGDWLPGGS
jgi:hypothetical protein